MTPRWRCAFSFYGGKSKIAHLYPRPQCEWIVEPFAGGAAYALRYAERRVWVNDVDAKVFGIWRFLTSLNAAWLVNALVPDQVEAGMKVSELLPDGPQELVWLLQAEANHGTQGARGVHDQVTKIGAKCWPRVKPRLLYWLPRVAHWRVTNLDYRELPNFDATWFIDPPYQVSGDRYRVQLADFGALAAWAAGRAGQVIVCEGEGATWLPFEPLCERRGIRSRYQRSRRGEMVWTRWP